MDPSFKAARAQECALGHSLYVFGCGELMQPSPPCPPLCRAIAVAFNHMEHRTATGGRGSHFQCTFSYLMAQT